MNGSKVINMADYKVVEHNGVEPLTSSMPWNAFSINPLYFSILYFNALYGFVRFCNCFAWNCAQHAQNHINRTRPRDYDFHAGIMQKPLKPAIYKGLNPFPLFHLVDIIATFLAQKPAQEVV